MSCTFPRALAAILLASLLGPAPASAVEPLQTRTTPIVVRVDDGGFRWADAGIGAVAGAGGALVLAGGVALLRASRTDGTRSQEGDSS